MMEIYALVKITVYAPGDDINNNELALSDELGEIEAELKQWLYHRTQKSKLTLEITSDESDD